MIIVYWAWRLGGFLSARLPARVGMRLARAIGSAGYYLMPAKRRAAHENFAQVLQLSANHARVRRVAHESFQNYVQMLRDVMIYPNRSRADIERLVSLAHPEYLEAALARGKGAVLVSVHYGNMDLHGARVANHFRRVTIIGEKLKPPELMEYMAQMRARNNLVIVDYERGPRELLGALKRNEFVVMLLDVGVSHHFNLTTVEIDFFGKRTPFIAGPAQAALMTGAAILVGYSRVTRDGRIEGFFNAPIIPQATSDRKNDLAVIMQEIGKQVEQFIRESPEQWYIYRPMWQNGNRH